jgi:pyroglutamyl-peptidase
MNILLTGFEAFNGEPVNPALQAVQQLDGLQLNGHRVCAVILPVVFDECIDKLAEAMRDLQPAIVLAVGQAGGRVGIDLERIAINVDDARIPDNAGSQPIDEPVVPGAPAAYFSTLPIKAMLKALRAAGIPAGISQTAGTFVCNHLFYGLQHMLATRYPSTRGGFVHIPYSPEQAARHPCSASMALPVVVQGLRLALETALAHQHDIKMAAGQID